MLDPTTVATVLKAAPELAKEVYSDLVADTLKEVSKIGVDAVKVVRLALFPLQAGAALQDRLAAYIDGVIRRVPEPQRIAPMESIFLPVAEKLRFQEPGNPVTELYLNLLARAMDGERVGEAHPAFVVVISQLAPDEITIMNMLAELDYSMIIKVDGKDGPVFEQGRNSLFDQSGMPAQLNEVSKKIAFKYEAINQPDLFYTFLEHLVYLGLVSYDNDPQNRGMYRGYGTGSNRNWHYWFIKLSSFGRLFFNACVAS